MTGWKGFDGFGTGGYELLVTYSEKGVNGRSHTAKVHGGRILVMSLTKMYRKQAKG